MPPKADPEKSEKEPTKKTDVAICGVRSPGPKYQLKTLVGYERHCLSRYRNPAYTFGARLFGVGRCEGPGPKYVLPDLKLGGFSFGLAAPPIAPFCGPGPKYILPTPKTPAFSIKSRTKPRGTCTTPGPYFYKTPRAGPAFSLGLRTTSLKCSPTPGPYSYEIKECTPKFSITARRSERITCQSPGPVYDVKPPKPTPAYSFGLRHGECVLPYIVECDDVC
ncbi:uncharacterized protein LOC143212979 [Lasioglossum baleicum]|uniref:uncharacterized protein LOC143212979 n=1 Tax=Lasioglossum baleicum TaxID=434251 RepID=UPI003FCE1940